MSFISVHMFETLNDAQCVNLIIDNVFGIMELMELQYMQSIFVACTYTLIMNIHNVNQIGN